MENSGKNPKNISKNALIWVLVLVAIAFGYDLFQNGVAGNSNNQPFSEFLSKLEEGQVSSVTLQGNIIKGRFGDGSQFSSYMPFYPSLVEKLQEKSVKIEVLPLETRINSLLGVILSWSPIIVIGGWIFFVRQMQAGGGGKAMGFGKSRAKLSVEKPGKVTFKDVAGIDEAKEELYEMVEFLREPQKFKELGARIPKGCLLVGLPGTGKTLVARAIAGESGCPFYSVSGSDFIEMFVGVGASRIRDLFEESRKKETCIIFIDEIDALGKSRSSGGFGGGNDEREQTLNQLLVEMDGFEAANENTVVIGATNRPEILDSALLRRFHRQINFPAPDLKGRREILDVHLAKISKAPNVNSLVLARGTPGFTGADLENMVNEGALLAARGGKKLVTMSDLESAKDKVMMGAERKSMIMSEEEKKLTAYHEGGHALVSIFLPISDPIHKATIMPRGRALGVVIRLPESDKFSVTKEKLLADIAIAMGGRAAEEILFGREKITSGASSDIKQATKMARAMVTEWGMSDKIGAVYHSGSHDMYSGHNSYHSSEETNKIIDAEIKSIVDQGYETAKKILNDQIEDLHLIAKNLLERETLTGEEIKELLKNRSLKEVINSETSKSTGSSLPKLGESTVIDEDRTQEA